MKFFLLSVISIVLLLQLGSICSGKVESPSKPIGSSFNPDYDLSWIKRIFALSPNRKDIALVNEYKSLMSDAVLLWKKPLGSHESLNKLKRNKEDRKILQDIHQFLIFINDQSVCIPYLMDYMQNVEFFSLFEQCISEWVRDHFMFIFTNERIPRETDDLNAIQGIEFGLPGIPSKPLISDEESVLDDILEEVPHHVHDPSPIPEILDEKDELWNDLDTTLSSELELLSDEPMTQQHDEENVLLKEMMDEMIQESQLMLSDQQQAMGESSDEEQPYQDDVTSSMIKELEETKQHDESFFLPTSNPHDPRNEASNSIHSLDRKESSDWTPTNTQQQQHHHHDKDSQARTDDSSQLFSSSSSNSTSGGGGAEEDQTLNSQITPPTHTLTTLNNIPLVLHPTEIHNISTCIDYVIQKSKLFRAFYNLNENIMKSYNKTLSLFKTSEFSLIPLITKSKRLSNEYSESVFMTKTYTNAIHNTLSAMSTMVTTTIPTNVLIGRGFQVPAQTCNDIQPLRNFNFKFRSVWIEPSKKRDPNKSFRVYCVSENDSQSLMKSSSSSKPQHDTQPNRMWMLVAKKASFHSFGNDTACSPFSCSLNRNSLAVFGPNAPSPLAFISLSPFDEVFVNNAMTARVVFTSNHFRNVISHYDVHTSIGTPREFMTAVAQKVPFHTEALLYLNIENKNQA
ncbi:hypothetical protein C9374_008414 [Naegleria lovaniensis]|uniref:Uncharacterized protein n=1 Tax=Naegleria lovaniensis TaxID=51637 RepID=A0AA88GJD9_NAELO|nr:uncharacterized protein C9374_008414 [Naegleria lovaniensis]KAG2378271.1 hypothetical protein C9374_008414 [Naegleria lovaniensis]